MLNVVDIIHKKRNGQVLTGQEIEYFIQGYSQGNIPDYQAAALAMAIYFQGMNGEETCQLAMAMAASGDILNLSSIPGIKVDKHSTGGVGDKTTLTVAPLVAAAGVPVAKMSGRGLGHTGGTVDKFESIPGFQVQLSPADFINQVRDIKLAVIAQSGNLVPADKKLYALRDVTATVESIPLIASSVMSKKLAAGADAILLDVKVGDGAFMKTLDEAALLARTMVDIGTRAGRKMAAVLTTMEQPLGLAIGNGLEVSEAVELLSGAGPVDLQNITLFLAGYMIYLGGQAPTPKDGQDLARALLEQGAGLAKLQAMVKRQGGHWPEGEALQLPVAPVIKPIIAAGDGYLSGIDTEKLGRTAMLLGAGREKIGDPIDYRAGIVLNKKPGDRVRAGDVLSLLYTSSIERAEEVSPLAQDLFHITAEYSVITPLILGVVTAEGEQYF